MRGHPRRLLLRPLPHLLYLMRVAVICAGIQFGQFRHLGEAIRWQAMPGRGIGKLFGRAAVFRSFYIAHGCCALNFARFEIERLIARMAND